MRVLIYHAVGLGSSPADDAAGPGDADPGSRCALGDRTGQLRLGRGAGGSVDRRRGGTAGSVGRLGRLPADVRGLPRAAIPDVMFGRISGGFVHGDAPGHDPGRRRLVARAGRARCGGVRRPAARCPTRRAVGEKAFGILLPPERVAAAALQDRGVLAVRRSGSAALRWLLSASGTTYAALGHGLPQLWLPQGADQFLNAAAIERVGAGLTLTGDATGTDAIASAPDRLLQETSFRAAAAGVAADIARMPGPRRSRRGNRTDCRLMPFER
jgi:hypothetical protein